MGLKLVTAPQDWPVTLEEAKAHLREDSDDFDTTIEAFIAAATEYVDGPKGYLGRALIDQTWDYYIDGFPVYDTSCRYYAGSAGWLQNNYIELPLPPLIEVIGVFYLNSSGVEQEFSSSSYVVDYASEPARISLKASGSWPSALTQMNAVRVRFRAGYLDQSVSPALDDVPFVIKAAILMYMADLYQNRENTIVGESAEELPFAAKMLLKSHRVYLSMA